MPLSSATLQALRTLAEQHVDAIEKVRQLSASRLPDIDVLDDAWRQRIVCRNKLEDALFEKVDLVALLDLAALALEVTRLRERIDGAVKSADNPKEWRYMSYNHGSDVEILRDLLKLLDHASASPGQTGA